MSISMLKKSAALAFLTASFCASFAQADSAPQSELTHIDSKISVSTARKLTVGQKHMDDFIKYVWFKNGKQVSKSPAPATEEDVSSNHVPYCSLELRVDAKLPIPAGHSLELESGFFESIDGRTDISLLNNDETSAIRKLDCFNMPNGKATTLAEIQVMVGNSMKIQTAALSLAPVLGQVAQFNAKSGGSSASVALASDRQQSGRTDGVASGESSAQVQVGVSR